MKVSASQKLLHNTEKLEMAASVLKTVAHPLRLSVISLLLEQEELGVNEICKQLNAEQSLVSHHLINMRLKGLLSCRKSGTSIYYSLKEKNLGSLLDCISHCKCVKSI